MDRNLEDYLNRQQEADAQLARNHYLGLKALLRDIRDSQGHISHQMERMMSAISDWADAQRASLTALNESLSGLRSDVDAMKALIEKLQNNPGPISPEDQKVLDELQALVKGAADTAKELDERTPPPEPPPA